MKRKTKARVGVIMGSQTDLKVMKEAVRVLEGMNVPCEVMVVSAHRTPRMMLDYAAQARERGLEVLIAGAGGAAHLPGMVASMTTLPVIGVPVTVNSLKGLDALLSIAQMPKGIPVATVAVDGAANAGLLAARILGVTDDRVQRQLEKHQRSQVKKVAEMNKALKKTKRSRRLFD